MRLDEAIELLEELKNNEDGSHYAQAIQVVLERLGHIEDLYESTCRELSAKL